MEDDDKQVLKFHDSQVVIYNITNHVGKSYKTAQIE